MPLFDEGQLAKEAKSKPKISFTGQNWGTNSYLVHESIKNEITYRNDRPPHVDLRLYTDDSEKATLVDLKKVYKLHSPYIWSKPGVGQMVCWKIEGVERAHFTSQSFEFNKPNAEGWTPLSLAAKNGNLETVKTLIAAGADVNKAETTYGSTPLFMAARNGHLEVVRALVGARANLNKARKDGLTPLSIANKHGRSSIVSYLQRKEAR